MFLCLLACTDYLGVENGDIPDANFDASHNKEYAYNARLNGPTAWWAPGSTSSPWIQVDIGYSTTVTGLLTQGKSLRCWIAQLKVSTFATTSDPEVFISDGNGNDKVNIADHLLQFKNQIRNNHSHFLMCDALLVK